jgi:hypothetical protein
MFELGLFEADTPDLFSFTEATSKDILPPAAFSQLAASDSDDCARMGEGAVMTRRMHPQAQPTTCFIWKRRTFIVPLHPANVTQA